MTIVKRLVRLRHLAQGLGILAIFLFVTSPLQGEQSDTGFVSAIQSLVPWAVGLIGVLVLYILKLTREVEKDFTDTKGSHSVKIVELEKGRIRNEGRIDLLNEQLAGIGDKITASRHQLRNDIGAELIRFEDRIQFIEQKLMDRQSRAVRTDREKA